jgi:anaerobic selenocysteine-containing dehydrogenase
MKITRRTLLKGAGVTGGATIAGGVLLGDLQTLISAERAGLATGAAEEWVPTACWIGKQDCGILARKVGGRVVKLEGLLEHPRNLGRLCPKGVSQITSLYDPNRVKTPLVRTNAKGEPGRWRPASWDEALALVADKLSAATARDPRLGILVEGRAGKVEPIYNKAFPDAVGIKGKGRRGNDCGGPSEDAVLATWGDRSPVTPDLRNCKYLICYWNLTNAGGPGLCQITLPREVVAAKMRGMKVVSINPYNRPVAHFADEWVPVKPGTDMAFWLAVIHQLLEGGFVDAEFLQARTNAPSLVQRDGMLLREGGQELVWDTRTSAAVPYGPGVDPALFGTFPVEGQEVKPALQVLKEHVSAYTPTWAADVTGVPATQIERVARELGENAMIGSTTVVDGVEVPYRPVAYGIHGAAVKFHNGVQTNRAILLAFTMLGAIESVGSAHLWSKKVADPTTAHKAWVAAAATATPKTFDLAESTWFPMGSSGYHMMPVTFLDPAKYQIPYQPEDMVVIVNYVNPLQTSRPLAKVMEAWQKLGFVAVITPYLTTTADYVGDVVLPCGTLDKWEGPLGGKTLYANADTIRVPLQKPYGQSRSETEIFLDLCEKMGKLYGPEGFLDRMNAELELADEDKLPLNRKPTVQQILGAWTRSKHNLSLAEFTQRGVVTKEVTAGKLYLNSGPTPLGGVRGAFYVDAFLTIRQSQQRNGVPESLRRYYTPYPTWTEPVIEQSPAGYDLYLMDFKRIEHKQARTANNPLLRELMPHNPLIMNATTAKAKHLEEGDIVTVESHNPVTGETARLNTTVTLVEGIRPDTVGITHHVGKPGEPSANTLFPYGEGFWDMGGGWYSHVKVRVYKGGEA